MDSQKQSGDANTQDAPQRTIRKARIEWWLYSCFPVAFFILFWALFFVWYDWSLGGSLTPDEAYYWHWSEKLDWGYFSKPPLIAYYDRLLTVSLGRSAFALRVGAIICSSFSLLALYGLTLKITGERRAALAAMLLPILIGPFSGRFCMADTNAPAMLFWLLTLYAFLLAIEDRPPMWILTGIFLGLGFLAKFTAIFQVLILGGYLALWGRKWFRTPGPFVALLCALAINLGVLYWNASHGWISLRHTAALGSDGNAPLGFAAFAENAAAFWRGQFREIHPIVFVFFLCGLVWTMRRKGRTATGKLLVLNLVTVLGFYAVLGVTRATYSHWTLFAWLSVPPMLAWMLARPLRNTRFFAGVIAAFFTVAAIMFLLHRNPGLSDTGEKFRQAAIRYGGGDMSGMVIASDYYGFTAIAAFYLPECERFDCLNVTGSPHTQYDFWRDATDFKGRDVLVFTFLNEEGINQWLERFIEEHALFSSGEVLETFLVRQSQGDEPVKVSVARMHGYAPPKSFR